MYADDSNVSGFIRVRLVRLVMWRVVRMFSLSVMEISCKSSVSFGEGAGDDRSVYVVDFHCCCHHLSKDRSMAV